MIWNSARECLKREDLNSLQDNALCDLVERVYYNVPFYREKMQAVGLEPSDIKSLKDL